MKSFISVSFLLVLVSVATAMLVVPPFREFENGLWVAVTEKKVEGQEFPTFEVVFFNPTRQEVKMRSMLRNFLPQSEKYGMMEVSSSYLTIASAFDEVTIQVPSMESRTYLIKKKVWSGYN